MTDSFFSAEPMDPDHVERAMRWEIVRLAYFSRIFPNDEKAAIVRNRIRRLYLERDFLSQATGVQ